MKNNHANEERSSQYLDNFDHQKTLKFRTMKSDPVIFDIGSNVGDSLFEFKKWWPESRIHCFEPQAECWPEWESQASSFDKDEIILNKTAVGAVEESGKSYFTHDINELSGSVTRRTGISGFNQINTESSDSILLESLKKGSISELEEYKKSINNIRKVPVIRMDKYLSEKKIDKVDLVKIDTQGHEPEVLEGFGERLKDVRVVLTELMFYDYYDRRLSFSDIEVYLHKAGFKLYDISHIAKNPMNGRTDWVDVIYVNDQYDAK